ncbi:hypothetical protein [Nocardioides kribbensis]|uniref:Uncharacterized protein n=1 Tax=Nocardioides kribbensis TaxID=305517 RepID=A0ABV1NTB3_9ACTN
MGLKGALARLAVQAPHVLVVETPGGWRVRVALEQELGRRGWRAATSPADADLLAVCGTPPSTYADPLATTWDQLPGPRARVDLTAPSTPYVAVELDRAVAVLLDDHHQRADADARTTELAPEETPEHGEMGHGEMGHGEMGHGEMGHGEMGHGEMDHGEMGHGEMGHGEMDHGEMGHGEMGGHDHMDMSGPGGVPLAMGGADRDGLGMDVLHLRLGPILPLWPAGLVLALALQGDVVTEATVEQVAEEDPGSVPAAYRCDAAAALLTLAGAPRLAAQASRARDQLLEDSTRADGLATLADLRRRIARSVTLRWSLRDLALVPGRAATAALLPEVWRGDVLDRLVRLLDLALAEAAGVAQATRDQAGRDAGDLSALVVGAELATVRLAVASVAGLGPAWVPPARTGGTHG